MLDLKLSNLVHFMVTVKRSPGEQNGVSSDLVRSMVALAKLRRVKQGKFTRCLLG
ncbi:hypothetical protein A2U01_0045390 [Trifolium medium]|uniref:Uncharacterized protein n=1 Tax=Trifolium medium TaxID=97028 RepID=A0A392QJX5_9FABA|nr:hypothetical protein [Trifolium medium]